MGSINELASEKWALFKSEFADEFRVLDAIAVDLYDPENADHPFVAPSASEWARDVLPHLVLWHTTNRVVSMGLGELIKMRDAHTLLSFMELDSSETAKALGAMYEALSADRRDRAWRFFGFFWKAANELFA